MTRAVFRRYLDDNELTGTVPTELGELTKLEWLCVRAASPKYEDF